MHFQPLAGNEVLKGFWLKLIPMNEALNSINEALNSVNEALNSVNEALNSVNEALNSVNEALNSVNEPLNSVNEPLNSVNEPLNSVNEALILVNNDQNFKNRGETTAFKLLQTVPQDRRDLLIKLDYAIATALDAIVVQYCVGFESIPPTPLFKAGLFHSIS
ncbi:hypothetical protein [Nostoc sp.]